MDETIPRWTKKDEPWSGWPSVIKQGLITVVDKDRPFTILILSLEYSNVGRTTFNKVSPKIYDFKKLCIHWVPRLRNEEHQMKRMDCALDLLDQYHTESDQLIENIVTGDKTSPHNPNNSRINTSIMERQHTTSPSKVKAKNSKHTRLWQLFWIDMESCLSNLCSKGCMRRKCSRLLCHPY